MPQYSQADVQSLLTKMADERAALVAAARSLSAAAAESVPLDAEGEAQWTAKEQLAHLWEMERSYVAWCRAALAQDGADLSGVTGERVPIPIEDATEHEVAELLAALARERQATLALIQSLALEDFHRTAKNAAFGELTVMQWLRSFYRHDRQHTAQIEGRQADYRPNFVNGVEPNQRRMRIEQVAARRAGQG